VAIIIHVVGDAIGSLAVIASGLFIHYTSYYYRYLTDPISSLIITAIIISQCIPLFRRSAHILLQFVPASIDTRKVIQQLQRVEGVMDIHDLHVYQLNTKKTVATLHVRLCKKMAGKWDEICDQLKLVLHQHKLHASCIQPEFDGLHDTHGCHCRKCLRANHHLNSSSASASQSELTEEGEEEKTRMNGLEETVIESGAWESSQVSKGQHSSHSAALGELGASSCWDVVCDNGKGECKKQQCCNGQMINFAH